MTTPKVGPFSIDELWAAWQTVVDRLYAQPFVQWLKSNGGSIDAGEDIPAAGENTLGHEVFTQALAQHARVSQAIDRNFQSMFILPWSGQSDSPGQGAQAATVLLAFQRRSRFELGIVLKAGTTLVEEVETDWGESGGVSVATGRRYRLAADLAFAPGEAGPKTITAVAERFGYSYNNPLPDSLTSIVQARLQMRNDGASIVPGVSTHRLVLNPLPDVAGPDHIGRYFALTTGSNAGQVRRMVGYEPIDANAPDGGVVVLARSAVLNVSSVVGTFVAGEKLSHSVAGLCGTFVYAAGIYMMVEEAASTLAAGVVTGLLSGAAATVDAVDVSPDMAAEQGTAAWSLLDWVGDLGFAVTNAESPTGGRAALLDELGDERKISRSPGETDEQYRQRVHALPDTVSPNAIRRGVNRILLQVGESCVLREAGLETLPGLYYDGNPSSSDPTVAFAYDLDFSARPADRYKVALSHLEMRAFMLVCVPRLGLGDFGFAFDDGASNAFDVAPWLAFFDGFPVNAAIIYRAIWQRVDDARAGGVGFDLDIV